MGTETIDQWQRRTGFERVAEDILSLPETCERDIVLDDIAERPHLEALVGRMTAGIAVQLLWQPASGATYVSVVWGDRDETFEVAPVDALEAFYHPFVYGCSLREERHVYADEDFVGIEDGDEIPV